MSYGINLRPRLWVLEFFAGIGLARLGLEWSGFDVVWANAYGPSKHAMHQVLFQDGPGRPYIVGDIKDVPALDLPRNAQLAWASSPCTDLPLAGSRAGLEGTESSASWLWLNLLREMDDDAPLWSYWNTSQAWPHQGEGTISGQRSGASMNSGTQSISS